MKKIIFAIFASVLVLTGCNKTETEKTGTGTLEFSLSGNLDDTYVEKGNGLLDGASTKAVSTEQVLNTMLVTISNVNGVGEPKQWVYSEMPSVLELTEGAYTVTVVSSLGDKLAAWDQPMYSATKDFNIVKNQTSTVELTCTISNAKVTVNCTEEFLAEFTNFTIVVRSSKATTEDGFLTWTKDEVDAGAEGYFVPGALTVTINAYRWSDATEQKDPVTYSTTISDVAARDHIILNVDAKATGSLDLGGNSTSSSFITIDDGTNDRNESVYIPGLIETPVDGGETTEPEEPGVETPAAPTLEWAANPTFEPMEISEGMDVELVVNCPGKIAGFVVGVQSETLNPIIGDSLDLLDETTASQFGSLLPTGDQLLGKTQVNFSLSSLVPMISAVGVPAGSEHIFTLTVTDEYGQKLEKSLTFTMPQ